MKLPSEPRPYEPRAEPAVMDGMALYFDREGASGLRG